ncbi:hypothetical protein L1887_20316 [Cichorium endivia]|nr:hypothetical protein L1887_20316 [Cichorium endivia]
MIKVLVISDAVILHLQSFFSKGIPEFPSLTIIPRRSENHVPKHDSKDRKLEKNLRDNSICDDDITRSSR